MFSVMAAQFLIRAELKWSVQFRNVGLIILGITIGGNFSLSILQAMGEMIWYVLLINCIFIAFCLFLAYLTAKYTNISLYTSVLATIPGALGQIIVFAAEEKNADLPTVTYFHIIRVLAVVSIIPFLITGHVSGGDVTTTSTSIWVIVLLIVVSYFFSILVGKLHIPTPFFLGPIILGVIFNLTSFDIPSIPNNLLHLAQLAIGAHIGLLLTPNTLKLPKKTLLFGLLNVVLLLVVGFLCANVLVTILHYSLPTSFLSTAPGGMDQMALIATSIQADADIVTIFQLARMLFLSFIIIPILKKYGYVFLKRK